MVALSEMQHCESVLSANAFWLNAAAGGRDGFESRVLDDPRR